MASIVNYVADGATNQFQIPFTYINQTDVVVTVNGATPTFTFLNTTTINIASTPTSGAKVIIKRVTPLNALVDFTDGSTLFEADLDLAHKQNRLIAEESRDRADSAIDTIDANITNIDTVAGIAANVTTVAGNTTNVNSVATNMAEVLLADTNAATATTKAGEASASASTASAQATISTTKSGESSTSAAEALASKNAASVSESNASASETASANSATSSANSASASSASAGNASASETVANTKASEAVVSANNSAVSATNSANSATTATTKANEASSSQNAAATSETNALSSKNAAASSATNAATSETNSASSATASANSASTATTKAGEASASATASANSATASANSATASANSATAAANSAASITGAETNAANSATAASASKDAALAALDNFDDRYLGVKSSNVSVDNDGNALVAGSLYFNSTDDTMKVFDGSTWVAAYASVSGAVLKTGSTMTGDLNIDSSSLKVRSTSGSTLELTNTSTTLGDNAFVGGLAFRNDDTSGSEPHYAGIKARTDGSGGTEMDLEFYANRDKYETDAPHMILRSTGDLHLSGDANIDGTAEAHKIEIGNGSAGGTSEILFSDNASGRGKIKYDHSDSPEVLTLETTGTIGLSIDNAQNVSIPNGNLLLSGVVQPTSANSIDLGLNGKEFRSLYVDTSIIASNALSITTGTTLTLDAAGDITLDADGGDIRFKDGGTEVGAIVMDDGSNTLIVQATQNDADIKFTGKDNNSGITALTLDMSDAGHAKFNSSVSLVDNAKLNIGTGSDLQIYHDGSNSYILDQGVGNLNISGNDVQILNAASNEAMAYFAQDGGVTLYHNGSEKLATTSSGIAVTGTATVGNSAIGSNTSHLANLTINNNGNIGSANNTSAMQIVTGGDVKFDQKVVANSSSSGDYVRMYGGSGTGKWDIYGSGANLRIGDNESAGSVQFDTRLLVGTTDTTLFNNTTGTGTKIGGDGRLDVARQADTVATFNRTGNSSGEVIRIVASGTTVGRIGNSGNSLYIESEGNSGAMFYPNAMLPIGGTSGTLSNGAVDLGRSGNKFKDGYFSGNLYGNGSNLTGVGGSTSYGEVGTYLFGQEDSGNVTENTTVAGSNLYPAGIRSQSASILNDGTAQPFLTGGNTSVSGTWRRMYRGNNGDGMVKGGLFVRIS